MDQYPAVRLDWIRHHNPELAIFENGAKTQTIDLSPYKYDALHELFTRHFTRGHARRLDEASASSAVPLPLPRRHTNATSNSSTITPAPRSSHDAALPQPVSDGWQAADPSMIVAGVDSLPISRVWTLALLFLFAAVVIVGLTRCLLGRRAGPKPPALDV